MADLVEVHLSEEELEYLPLVLEAVVMEAVVMEEEAI